MLCDDDPGSRVQWLVWLKYSDWLRPRSQWWTPPVPCLAPPHHRTLETGQERPELRLRRGCDPVWGWVTDAGLTAWRGSIPQSLFCKTLHHHPLLTRRTSHHHPHQDTHHHHQWLWIKVQLMDGGGWWLQLTVRGWIRILLLLAKLVPDQQLLSWVTLSYISLIITIIIVIIIVIIDYNNQKIWNNWYFSTFSRSVFWQRWNCLLWKF